MEKKLHRM